MENLLIKHEDFEYLSDWFWNIIAESNKNRDQLKLILSKLTKEEIIRFQEQFVDASAELQDSPYIENMEESEDGIEDIANWIVSNGKKFYFEMLNNPKSVPYSVNDHTDEILYGIADEVCVEVYGESTGVY